MIVAVQPRVIALALEATGEKWAINVLGTKNGSPIWHRHDETK